MSAAVSPQPAAPARAAKNAQDYTALAAYVRESGLLKRRYGYYWTRLISRD